MDLFFPEKSSLFALCAGMLLVVSPSKQGRKIKAVPNTAPIRMFKLQSCDRSGHIQNGKPARHKNPEKMGKKMEHGPKPEIAQKWPKWKNGQKMAKITFWGPFSISVAISRPFWAWGHFPFSFPFCRDFCVGPVSILSMATSIATSEIIPK